MNKPALQKISVLLTLSDADKILILNGIKTAVIFGKELCLVIHHKKRDNKKRTRFRQKLQEYITPLKKEIPALTTSSLLLSGHMEDLPERLADDYETILIVAGAGLYGKYSQAAAASPVPFLFVSPDAPVSPFKKIVMPIDLRAENSDSALWCSWFGRFNKSEVIAVAADDKGHEEKRQLARNVFLTKKLFRKFHIPHKIFKGRRSSLGNAFEALELAQSSESDLFILLGSSTITLLDLLIGLPERKIIRQASQFPILLVNPRRDNYILCD